MNVKVVILILLSLASFSDSLPVFLRRKWLGSGGMLRSFKSAYDDVPAQWLQQILDHFNTSSVNVTWKQRYWINDSYWNKESGPVFLMIGGEGEATSNWVLEGEMMDLAQKYKGFAAQLEHRFYGKSQPASDLSNEHLQYLTSEQAIADLAYFHDIIVKQYNMTSSNRWIAVGGSYSGALAAWVKIKYPDRMYGALATSAPVQAQYDFYQYLEVVGKSLAQARNGIECVSAISSAFSTVDTMLNDVTQWPTVDHLFNLSTKLTSEQDGKLLSLSLAGMFMGIVQYNNDSRGNETYDMSQLCDVMTNELLGNELERLIVLADMFGIVGHSSSFEEYLNAFSNITIDPSIGERQWFYQTCNEFGYFQTSDSSNQPFGSLISIDLYITVCQKIFNLFPSQTQSKINDTNVYYGGRNIDGSTVTNIILPNGSIDPWHALGITSIVSDSVVAIYIEGTAHCANMYPSSPYDAPSLVEARKEIDSIIGNWLKT